MTQAMLTRKLKDLRLLFDEANRRVGNRAPAEQIDFVTWGYIRGRIEERMYWLRLAKEKGWFEQQETPESADKGVSTQRPRA